MAKRAGRTHGERSTNSLQTLIRAEWINERRAERPSLSRQRLIHEVRERFRIGKTQAEQAMKVAAQLLRDAWVDEDSKQAAAELVGRKYLELAELAERKGELRAARSNLDSYVRLRGLAAPDKVEHSGQVGGIDFEALTDEQLAVLAVVDRKKAGEDDSETE